MAWTLRLDYDLRNWGHDTENVVVVNVSQRKSLLIGAMSALLALEVVASIALLMFLWHSCGSTVGTADGSVKVDHEVSMLLVVLASSCIGSSVHATMSFVTYVGNGTFRGSWVPWYFLRAFVGASVSILLYIAWRAGLPSGPQDPSQGLFSASAIGGLSGLFAKQAADKLEEIFDAAFRTAASYGDSRRSDPAMRGVGESLIKSDKETEQGPV